MTAMFSRRAVAACCCAALLLTASQALALRTQSFDVGAGGPIPASGTSGLASFDFEVANVGTVLDADLQLAIRHTWLQDLAVGLVDPTGREVQLIYRIGSYRDNYQDTYLDDEASLVVGSAGTSAPYAGSYRPAENPLSSFDGVWGTGTWQLRVYDVALIDSGWLYAPGEQTPWGTAAGTRLILTDKLPPPNIVPEPLTVAGLLGGTAAAGGYLLRRRRA
jgi:subtilisin-like proprotein convertase family protein